jgi:dihydropteroate synthase
MAKNCICGHNFSIPLVMGILNLTPDSFFASSRKQTEAEIAETVVCMLRDGADIIDVGACSTRPGSTEVSSTEELNRLRFGLKILFHEAPDAVVSVDTFRAEVAACAVEEFGVAIVNDVSGGNADPQLISTITRLQTPYVLTHSRGTPMTMMADTRYGNPTEEIIDFFDKKLQALTEAGVADVWLDPGFGFSKTTAQNYDVLRNLRAFKKFEKPLLVGFSRKTMIREILDASPDQCLNGTTALNMFALTSGANILRVHDVKEATETVKLFNAINKTEPA